MIVALARADARRFAFEKRRAARVDLFRVRSFNLTHYEPCDEVRPDWSAT